MLSTVKMKVSRNVMGAQGLDLLKLKGISGNFVSIRLCISGEERASMQTV